MIGTGLGVALALGAGVAMAGAAGVQASPQGSAADSEGRMLHLGSRQDEPVGPSESYSQSRPLLTADCDELAERFELICGGIVGIEATGLLADFGPSPEHFCSLDEETSVQNLGSSPGSAAGAKVQPGFVIGLIDPRADHRPIELLAIELEPENPST